MKTKDIIDTSINELVVRLKKENLLIYKKLTPFQKVEMLLYNYDSFKDVIKDKEEQIEEIKAVGIRKKSGSIIKYTGDIKTDVRDDFSKAEEQILAIENSIVITKNFIKIADKALDKLKDEQYFDILDMKYFQNMSHEQIANELNVDVSTVYRHKNKLIGKLQVILFSDEVIEMIFL